VPAPGVDGNDGAGIARGEAEVCAGASVDPSAGEAADWPLAPALAASAEGAALVGAGVDPTVTTLAGETCPPPGPACARTDTQVTNANASAEISVTVGLLRDTSRPTARNTRIITFPPRKSPE